MTTPSRSNEDAVNRPSPYARSISPVEGITFESSIRSRESASGDLIIEKQRVEESNALRKSVVQRQKEPLLNIEGKKAEKHAKAERSRKTRQRDVVGILVPIV